MISKLKALAVKESFNPKILGLIANPFYIARRGLYRNIKAIGGNVRGQTLDVGCGTKPYQSLFNYEKYIGLEYDTGIDMEKKQADFYYDGKTFPFENEEFDTVITNQVLEHVFTPYDFLKEINRVLKPGGTLLLTVPFVWDEHEQPFDYARYSSFGLVHLLETNGFRIKQHIKSIPDFSVIIQLINGYLYKITRKYFLVKQLVQLLIIFPLNVLALILSNILPDNKDLYLDNIVLAYKEKLHI